MIILAYFVLMKFTEENTLLSLDEKDFCTKNETWPELPPINHRLDKLNRTIWVKPNGEGEFGLVASRINSHKISHNKIEANEASKNLKETGRSNSSDKQFSASEDDQGSEDKERVENPETQPQICDSERSRQPLSIEMIVSNFIKEQPFFYQKNQSASLNQSKSACNELTKSLVENAVEQKEETIKPKQTQAHSAEHKTKDKLKPTYRIFVSTTPRTGNGSKKARQPVTDLDQLSVSELKEKITELKSELRFDAKFKFNGTQSYLANKTRRYIRYRRNNQNKWLSNLEITEICGAINKKFGALTNNAIFFLIFDCFARKAYTGYKNPKSITVRSDQSEQSSEYGLPEIIQSIVQWQRQNLKPKTWKEALDCLISAKDSILPPSQQEDQETFNLRFEATILEGLLFFKNK